MSGHECPTCGRVSEDWTSNRDPGVKRRQRRDKEDRLIAYRDWRRTLGKRFWVTDVDHLEWRTTGGSIFPVAVLELSMVKGTMPLPQSYLKAVQDRFLIRDGQGMFAMKVAELLECDAFIVLFRWDMSEFWVMDFFDQQWVHYTEEEYREWLQGL